MENESLLEKPLTQDETITALESSIKEALFELEQVLLPQLGHSQAKRLLLAAMAYPMREDKLTLLDDGEAYIRGYSACKAISDSLVALGVEVVLEQMMKNQTEINTAENSAEEN